jgi:hypothetical protein
MSPDAIARELREAGEPGDDAQQPFDDGELCPMLKLMLLVARRISKRLTEPPVGRSVKKMIGGISGWRDEGFTLTPSPYR